ncbi:hypothetical protein CI610_02742 [invertebrate metagenome]|uniref:Peptidase A2 domain-containing protein n=1 Tax=invertebrate metagenome TaxID=1711999 RepID=A0A2H9T541_9ZZZZ|nr:retroviral-like aspartic protease 1 [Pecten maximus]
MDSMEVFNPMPTTPMVVSTDPANVLLDISSSLPISQPVNSEATGAFSTVDDAFCVTSKPEVVYINRICASSSLVKVTVGEVPITARIDSGAEMTIISTSVFDRLRKKPKKLKDVVMHLADTESSLNGTWIAPISLKIGSSVFKESVYVAPISDEMLLGHDLLHKWGTIHDMKTDTLLIGEMSCIF